MRVGLGIGERVQYVDIDEKNYAGTLNQNNVEIGLTGEAEVRRALEEPVGSPRLRDIVEPGEKIAVITSDISRPCPSRLMLPALMDELGEAGVSDDDVTVVFGLGSHRHQTDDERRKLVGDTIYDRVKCIDSTPEDTVSFGATKRGTPVDISRAVAEADRRICLANIEYHYFAGYSGGAKSIMPGVSTPGAIQENHRSMVDPDAYTGHLEGNPVREDIEEAAAMVGADFILNVVLDEDKRIVKAVAGDMTEAHRTGCEFLDRLYAVGIGERADIVIVSQGGAPKDLNLYQLQKALDNSKHAVKKGGIIILIGSCREGLGNETFAKWMDEAEKPDDLVDRLNERFTLGGHKAAAIALVMRDADICLVSDMDPDYVKSIFFTPFRTAQEALDAALEKKGPSAKVLVMPHGGSVLPRIAG